MISHALGGFERLHDLLLAGVRRGAEAAVRKEVIAPSEVDRLFQPFQRLDPRRGHQKDGHGLGLSIVRAVADAHLATVLAVPESEGGLSVAVSFPEKFRGEFSRTPR